MDIYMYFSFKSPQHSHQHETRGAIVRGQMSKGEAPGRSCVECQLKVSMSHLSLSGPRGKSLPSFCSIKQLGVLLLSLKGMLGKSPKSVVVQLLSNPKQVVFLTTVAGHIYNYVLLSLLLSYPWFFFNFHHVSFKVICGRAIC